MDLNRNAIRGAIVSLLNGIFDAVTEHREADAQELFDLADDTGTGMDSSDDHFETVHGNAGACAKRLCCADQSLDILRLLVEASNRQSLIDLPLTTVTTLIDRLAYIADESNTIEDIRTLVIKLLAWAGDHGVVSSHDSDEAISDADQTENQDGEIYEDYDDAVAEAAEAIPEAATDDDLTRDLDAFTAADTD